ncbi:hypothetical protein [Spongiactinospora sp. TRM90649]|uniref:hypothetical protein n=1 Tax=Spongiactinospora sp. TRM90649 TaxID=3031114 RepID=UPI0023F8C972|nr:hypothetical protein [Spongiactinospora sp. TRM90649]MDF5755731.1 hypothetical protein [Spongiactinospora sp. TRM90649]
MRGVTRLVLVHDGACGGCSSIAAALAGLLTVPVVTRSCRDPHLAAELPVLRAARPRDACAVPMAVAIDGSGGMELLRGVRLPLRTATLVAPGRRAAALRLGLRALWRHLARSAARHLEVR